MELFSHSLGQERTVTTDCFGTLQSVRKPARATLVEEVGFWGDEGPRRPGRIASRATFVDLRAARCLGADQGFPTGVNASWTCVGACGSVPAAQAAKRAAGRETK